MYTHTRGEVVIQGPTASEELLASHTCVYEETFQALSIAIVYLLGMGCAAYKCF